jgi:hypothetical protein
MTVKCQTQWGKVNRLLHDHTATIHLQCSGTHMHQLLACCLAHYRSGDHRMGIWGAGHSAACHIYPKTLVCANQYQSGEQISKFGEFQS